MPRSPKAGSRIAREFIDGDRPLPLSDVIRDRMEHTARRDTGPELDLRRSLHAMGRRFYVDRSPLKGMRSRADLVFPGLRVAVFVDGCFWHGCPIHGTSPKNNAGWWRAKLDANRSRDARVTRELLDAGWAVIRIWEHEALDTAVERVVAALDAATVIRRARGSAPDPDAARARTSPPRARRRRDETAPPRASRPVPSDPKRGARR